MVRATADIPHQFRVQKVKDQAQPAALGGCSSHHLQGAGAYWGGRTTGRTVCITSATCVVLSVNRIRPTKKLPIKSLADLCNSWT